MRGRREKWRGTLTVPVKYVRNDNIIPFSRIDCTRALTIMPGIRRSIEIPLRSFVCIRVQQKYVKLRKTVEDSKGNDIKTNGRNILRI